MDTFAALADPTRRDLLRSVARTPARVVDLAARHPISRPAISRHLRVLGEAGLVTAEDRGRERHYRADLDGLAPVRALLAELRDLEGGGGLLPRGALDALETEVRRTVRERRPAATARDAGTRHPGADDTHHPTEETA